MIQWGCAFTLFLKIANGAKITAVVFKKEVDDMD